MTLFTWWFFTVDITTYQIDGELVHQIDIFSHGTNIIPNASFVYGLNYYCLVLLQSGHYSPQHVVAFMDGEECNSAWYHTQHTRQKPLSPPCLLELIGCAEGEVAVNVDDMDDERLAKWRRMVFKDARQDRIICF